MSEAFLDAPAGVRYVDLETDRGQAGAKPFGLRTSTLHAPILKS